MFVFHPTKVVKAVNNNFKHVRDQTYFTGLIFGTLNIKDSNLRCAEISFLDSAWFDTDQPHCFTRVVESSGFLILGFHD